MNEPRRLRRPKGANLRTIMACVDETPGGASAGEIQRKTALAWSSVQSTLRNHPDLFVEESGLWKLGVEARQSVDSGIKWDDEELRPKRLRRQVLVTLAARNTRPVTLVQKAGAIVATKIISLAAS